MADAATTTPDTTDLSAHDIRRLAVAAFCAPRTVRRAYRGEVVREISVLRISDAANTLGLPLPPRAAHR
jgi:hypothetical protein